MLRRRRFAVDFPPLLLRDVERLLEDAPKMLLRADSATPRRASDAAIFTRDAMPDFHYFCHLLRQRERLITPLPPTHYLAAMLPDYADARA